MLNTQHIASALMAGVLLLPGCRSVPEPRTSPPEESPATSSFRIPENAVGFAFVTRHSPEFFEVAVVFPEEIFDDNKDPARLESSDSVELRGNLTLFDSGGTRASLEVRQTVQPERWCENDGGYHHRPSFTVKIPRKDLSATLAVSTSDKPELFAVLGPTKRLRPITSPLVLHEKEEGEEGNEITRTLIHEGRLHPDGAIVVRVVEVDYQYSAGCGDEMADPSLILETATGQYELRCCGP